MPSARVVCIALLAGLGATTAVFGGIGDQAGDGAASTELRGGQVSSAATSTPTSTPTPTPAAGAVDFDVRAENRRPGSADWRVPAARAEASGVEVRSLASSVDAGAKVPLMMTAAGSGPVAVQALRIGWYGGAGSRVVWRGDLPATAAGTVPSLDSTGWPPGHYLLRFDRSTATRTLPLTVRSPQTRGDVVLLASTLTWQLGNAAGFVPAETGLVQQAERHSRRLAYATDADVSRDPALLAGAAAVVTGDSRQWTPQLRTALRSAAAAGTNLAFFGAGTGSRTIELPEQDPPPGAARAALVVSSLGGRKASAADRAAISRLSGQRPDCGTASTPATAWTVTDPGWWGYRGTGTYAGQQFPGLVDDGTDGPVAGTSSEVVARTAFSCAGRPSTQVATYRVLPSGAAVFGAGTSGWSCALNRTCAVPPETRTFAVQVTRNLIAAIAEPEAGRRLAAG